MARGPKSSSFMGAKKRGHGCHALEMRRRCRGGRRTRRFELAGFPTQKHAALGRDFFIVLDGDGDGDLSKQLNFPLSREHLARFAEQRGMEFKVNPEEEKGKFKWDGDKKKRFIALVEDLNQIIPAEPARAEEIGVADIVQVNNGGTGQGHLTQLQREGDPVEVQCDPFQGDEWDIDKGIQQSDDSIKKFRSRESESAIYPQLSIEELQALLSEKETLISEKEALLSQNEALLSEKEALLSKNEALLSEKEALLFEKEALLSFGLKRILRQKHCRLSRHSQTVQELSSFSLSIKST